MTASSPRKRGDDTLNTEATPVLSIVVVKPAISEIEREPVVVSRITIIPTIVAAVSIVIGIIVAVVVVLVPVSATGPIELPHVLVVLSHATTPAPIPAVRRCAGGRRQRNDKPQRNYHECFSHHILLLTVLKGNSVEENPSPLNLTCRLHY